MPGPKPPAGPDFRWSPYRDPPRPVEDKLRRAAETELLQKNMLRWRNGLIGVTAASSLWPYLHAAPLSILHLSAALLAGVCAVEEWRLRRLVRRHFDEIREDVTENRPPFQS